MCHGRIAPKSTSAFASASVGHGVFLRLVILSTLLGDGLASVCSLPPEPENGGYVCHPRPCRDPLNAGSVIEYLCAEGYMLKGDYKYLTCKNGEWKPAMEISCRLNEGQFGRWERGAAGVLLAFNSGDVAPVPSGAPHALGQRGPADALQPAFLWISRLCERHWGCWCVSPAFQPSH